MTRYVVCCGRPWAVSAYEKIIRHYPGEWFMLGPDDTLLESDLEKVKPRYVFFLHWSSMIAKDITARYECVNFHMTDLPYGRGGSPLQNLILRGHQTTMITAHRMTAELDAGSIYMQREMHLGGTAEEIYVRAMEISAAMIKDIIEQGPEPYAQVGKPVVFRRRKPEQSEIEDEHGCCLQRLYDHLRMLDCDGYPRAYLLHGGLRYEFSRPALRNGKIVADVTITEVGP